MSMMACSGCSRYVDTDENVEGVWEDKGTRYWCDRCLEEAAEEADPENVILANFKVQDPAGYADIMDIEPVADAR